MVRYETNLKKLHDQYEYEDKRHVIKEERARKDKDLRNLIKEQRKEHP
jgi:hypothetical protein